MSVGCAWHKNYRSWNAHLARCRGRRSWEWRSPSQVLFSSRHSTGCRLVGEVDRRLTEAVSRHILALPAAACRLVYTTSSVHVHHHHHHHHLFNKTDWQNAIIHNIKKHENLINVIEENFVQMITTVVRLLGGNCWLINVFEQHSVYVISAISFDR